MMMTRVLHGRWARTAWHGYKLLTDRDYRAGNRESSAAFRRFCEEEGGLGLKADVSPRGVPLKTALIVGQSYLPFARLEALMLKALQMGGFRTVVMGNRRYDFLRYGWLAGNRTVVAPTDFARHGDPAWVAGQVDGLNTLQDWLNLEYKGVHVGRFTIASTLRYLKLGQLDYSDPSTRGTLRYFLENSVHYTRGATRLIDAVKPDGVLLMDRGYTGQGEVFDLAINRGIDAIVWNVGYKSNRLVVKRYNRSNEREHPLCPSADTWQRLRFMTWKPEYGHTIRQELFQCYDTQDWFSVVGTQFDKRILSQQETRQKLGLHEDKKVAVVFPHILWDGSFFFGTDLFDDYTQWLVETIRAASANPRLQWVVKLHPAHLVKAKQGNDPNQPSEVTVIEKTFGSLPPHVILIHPDTQISTYSLFQIADYAVTVRGTVGIESALFGVPAATAGTGRYDRRGFTLDSSTREEYLQKLATLETYPRLSREQIETAERYAYGTFFGRPLPLSSATLEYARDAKATPRFKLHCQTREQWLAASDIPRLAAWLANGTDEDMLQVVEL
jgi:hypothetical protein